jgi:biopolymer transport protein ExbD
MRINLEEEDQPEIGLVALIDCIFFLLMFFMVATSFKQQQTEHKERKLAIVLPTSSVTLEKGDAAEDALVIAINEDGKFSIDNDVLSAQALTMRLRQERQARPAMRVQIDGDRRTSYQHIVHVLDLCQFEGITDIAMRVRN